MADRRFFTRAGPFTLSQLSQITGAEIGGAADPEAVFEDVAPLDAAGPEDVSFLDNKLYAEAFAASRAGACLVAPAFVGRAPKSMALLITRDSYRAYARVAQAFYPLPAPSAGIAAGTAVHETASLGEGCEVSPGAVIEARTEIGNRCRIGANAVICEGVRIGDDCMIGAGAVVSYALVGDRVILHSGVRVGQDGFGFAPGAEGHEKVPQLGRVIIGDDVEVGANTTIDRGTGPDTVIGAGTKIDNLVQIGHNVRLGRSCLVVAQVGISGSTQVGDFVMIGGQAGLAGHLKIGDGARIAAQSGVMRDVEPGATMAGSPAFPAREYWRQVASLSELARKKTGE